MSASKSHQVFWPDKARLVISISMQFETGAQPDRGAGSPIPTLRLQHLHYSPTTPAQRHHCTVDISVQQI